MSFNPDEVRPESIKFFKTALKSHKKVIRIEELSRDLFDIYLDNNNVYRVFLTNIYTIGAADVIEITEAHQNINAIVTMSTWNGYTAEAKDLAQSFKLGLFIYKELSGALNIDRPENYYSYINDNGQKVYDGLR